MSNDQGEEKILSHNKPCVKCNITITNIFLLHKSNITWSL